MLQPLLWLSLACASVSATLTVSSGKLSIIDSVASSASLSTTFTSDSLPSPPLVDQLLSSTDTLKLSFQVTDKESGQPIQPHQAVVSWLPVNEEEQKQYGRQWASVIKVRSTGKARWELDLSKAPTSLLSLSQHSLISLTLLLGTPHHPGLSLPLGTFRLSSDLSLPFPYPPNEDLPKHWEVEKYSTQPRIDWTFKGEEKRVGKFKSFAGLGLVLSPWIVLWPILHNLRPSLSLRSPSISQTILLVSLVAFEALFVLYWIQLRLIPTLPWFAGLAVVVVLSGKSALGGMRGKRLEREKKELRKDE
ncbi:hypothetical protein JCM5353_002085 [Sporobolomyces roseus]